MGKWAWIIGAVIIASIVGYIVYPEPSVNGNTTLVPNEFGQCLQDKGATFYGAYWCPHCSTQKEILGTATGYVYTECDSKGKNPDPAACQRAGVKVFPTWVINGQKYEGVLQKSQLERLTNC